MNKIRARIAQSLARKYSGENLLHDNITVVMGVSRAVVEQEASAFFASMARAAMGLGEDEDGQVKTVRIPDEFAKHLSVKTAFASDLTREDVGNLMVWCDFQSDSLWDGMSMQEILNVYRASAEWVTWEGWADEDWEGAYKAWNEAVIDQGNKLIQRS